MEGSSQQRVSGLWLWVAIAVVVAGGLVLGGPYYAIQYAAIAGMAVWGWRTLEGLHGLRAQPDHVRTAVGWLSIAGLLVDCFIVRPSLDSRVFGFLVLGLMAAWWAGKLLIQWSRSGDVNRTSQAAATGGGTEPAPLGRLIREGGKALFGNAGDPRVDAARRVTRVVTRRRDLADGEVLVTIEDVVSAQVRNVRMSQLGSLGGRLAEGHVLSETDERLLALDEPAEDEIALARKSRGEHWYREMFDGSDRPLDD